jgi:hypothetical protein
VLWKFTASTPDEGACYYIGDNGATTVEAIGWVTDLTGNDATVFSDAQAIPTAGNDLYGMKTYYSTGSNAYTSKTFRVKGSSDDHDLKLHGCVPESCTIRGHAGMIVMAEWTFRFNDWAYETASGDGLPTAELYRRLEPIFLENDGRLVIDGPTAGTASPAGTAGVGDFEIELTADLHDLPQHGGSQGVGDVLIMRRNARATFTLPYTTDWITGTEADVDISLEDGTTHSIELHLGQTVGKVFALIIPAAVVVEQAQLADTDGLMAWQTVWEPEEYTGDTGTTLPANTTFRIAMG